MTNFTSAARPSSAGLRRPSSGRRAKKAPVVDLEEKVPLYVQPFENNNAWSTLVSLSPQSTIAEVRQTIQSRLDEEQKRPNEWWQYKPSRPTSGQCRPQSAHEKKEEQPELVYNDESLSDSMKLCELSSLKPYTTLRLERPTSFSARRRRGSLSLVSGGSGSQKLIQPVAQSSAVSPAQERESSSATAVSGGSGNQKLVQPVAQSSSVSPAQERESSSATAISGGSGSQKLIQPVAQSSAVSPAQERESSSATAASGGSGSQKLIQPVAQSSAVSPAQEQEFSSAAAISVGSGNQKLVQPVAQSSSSVSPATVQPTSSGDTSFMNPTSAEDAETEKTEQSQDTSEGGMRVTAERYSKKIEDALLGPLLGTDDGNDLLFSGQVECIPPVNNEGGDMMDEMSAAGTDPAVPAICEMEIKTQATTTDANSVAPAAELDEDDELEELSPRFPDVGEMPLHSRPVSAIPDIEELSPRSPLTHGNYQNELSKPSQCEIRHGNDHPRCESVTSTVLPSSSPAPFHSLASSPVPHSYDDAFQEVIQDLEKQLLRERAQRESLRDSLMHEQAQLTQEQQTAQTMRDEIGAASRTIEEERERLRSQEENEKEREGEWHQAKEALEQRCTQFQNRCWELKEDQKAYEWRLQDEMQSEIQEALREEDQQYSEFRDQVNAELQAERKQIDDHAQYVRSELSEAHAAHEATKAVQCAINFACLKINFKEVVPNKMSVEHGSAEVVALEAKNQNDPELPKQGDDLLPLLYSELFHHGQEPSREECQQLLPLQQYSTPAERLEDAAKEREALRQECSELLPILRQELVENESTVALSPAKAKNSSDAGSLSITESTECDQLRQSIKQLEADAEKVAVRLAEREEEAKLLKEAKVTQEEKAKEDRKQLEAEGDQLRVQMKQSKHNERHMRHVLFWSTYLCGCICATGGAVMYFIFRDS